MLNKVMTPDEEEGEAFAAAMEQGQVVALKLHEFLATVNPSIPAAIIGLISLSGAQAAVNDLPLSVFLGMCKQQYERSVKIHQEQKKVN